MSKESNHSTFSFGISALYGLAGFFIFGVSLEHSLLSSVIIFIAAMLPDIDSDSENTGREVGSLLAVVAPLVLLEYFPDLRVGGLARVTLVVVCSYIFTRLIFTRLIQSFTSYRGIIHSVPAAIITFELTYLLFWDLFWFDRLFIATAAFVGYFSHLMLDAYGNLDLVNQAMGKGGKDSSVIKFKGATTASTFAAYSIMLSLGYVVVRDIYPALQNHF